MALRREAMRRDFKCLLRNVFTVIDRFAASARSISTDLVDDQDAAYKIYNLDKDRRTFLFSSSLVCSSFTNHLVWALADFGVVTLVFKKFARSNFAVYRVHFKTGKDPFVLAYQMHLALAYFAQLETKLAYLAFCEGIIPIDATLRMTQPKRPSQFNSLPSHLTSREKVVRLLRSR